MKRPNGSGQLTASYWLFGASLCLAVLAFAKNVTDWKGDIDPEALAVRWLMGIASGSLFSLGLILLSVGWIIRAIYFLPGRELDEEIEARTVDHPKALNPTVSAFLILAGIAVAGLIAQAVLAPS